MTRNNSGLSLHQRCRPWLYDLFQCLIGADKGRTRLADELITESYPTVLDLGCGNGMLLKYLGREVLYLGLDISPDRVARARHLWPSHEFLTADAVTLARQIGPRRFRLIVASGLLHHLSDIQAETMLTQALAALESGGSILLVDPVYFRGQGPLSRLLCLLDAGRWVRTMEGYRLIVPSGLRVVRQELRDDLLHIPQSLQVMVLTAEEGEDCRR